MQLYFGEDFIQADRLIRSRRCTNMIHLFEIIRETIERVAAKRSKKIDFTQI